MANNMRMEGWRDIVPIVETGDENLALQKRLPLAIRTQAYAQVRQGEAIDPETGFTDEASDVDFQSPYLIKILSSAPLSDHLTFYFYAIFAEKGGNGEVIVEDAWFRHDDVFGTGVALQLGQFQISDLMFPREIRLPFQDYMVYRMAKITYDRGILLDRSFGPVDVAIGAMNGNGITANYDVNSPGYRRPDNLFDNDTKKSVFGRVGVNLEIMRLGVFGLSGEQKNVTGPVGGSSGDRDTDKVVYGVDASGNFDEILFWYAQGLWNQWDGFIDENKTYEWFGGFVGVDYIATDKWVLSLLYNYADAGDFENTGTVYEGIAISSLTATVSYYFMTNVKGIIEGNYDFLQEDDDDDFVGHETQEGYLLIGIDAAF